MVETYDTAGNWDFKQSDVEAPMRRKVRENEA